MIRSLPTKTSRTRRDSILIRPPTNTIGMRTFRGRATGKNFTGLEFYSRLRQYIFTHFFVSLVKIRRVVSVARMASIDESVSKATRAEESKGNNNFVVALFCFENSEINVEKIFHSQLNAIVLLNKLYIRVPNKLYVGVYTKMNYDLN